MARVSFKHFHIHMNLIEVIYVFFCFFCFFFFEYKLKFDFLSIKKTVALMEQNKERGNYCKPEIRKLATARQLKFNVGHSARQRSK
jgi:uncharacterized membrane protein